MKNSTIAGMIFFAILFSVFATIGAFGISNNAGFDQNHILAFVISCSFTAFVVILASILVFVMAKDDVIEAEKGRACDVSKTFLTVNQILEVLWISNNWLVLIDRDGPKDGQARLFSMQAKNFAPGAALLGPGSFVRVVAGDTTIESVDIGFERFPPRAETDS